MLSKIRITIAAVATALILALGAATAVMGAKLKHLEEDLSLSKANETALLMREDSNKNTIRSLQLSVEQLDYFNDSILTKLNKARKELKVKDKEIKELQYLKTQISSKDTVFITDTIFQEGVCLDTIIKDEWHSVDMHLCYPGEIIVNPSFVSEKIIVSHLKKETIDPPKKCWLARLFQKKHKVIVVDVKESNPYVETQEYRHIDIVK